jgi:hypothetical protein
MSRNLNIAGLGTDTIFSGHVQTHEFRLEAKPNSCPSVFVACFTLNYGVL